MSNNASCARISYGRIRQFDKWQKETINWFGNNEAIIVQFLDRRSYWFYDFSFFVKPYVHISEVNVHS